MLVCCLVSTGCAAQGPQTLCTGTGSLGVVEIQPRLSPSPIYSKTSIATARFDITAGAYPTSLGFSHLCRHPRVTEDRYDDFETRYRGSSIFYVAGIQPPMLTSLLCRVDGMVLPNIHGGA